MTTDRRLTTDHATIAPTGQFHVVFGTGPVGQAIARALLARGHQVRAVNRSGRAELPPGVELIAGDAGDPAFAMRASAGATVIYNALNPPYHQWPELFPRLQQGVLAGAAGAGARLVVMENLYGYGPADGQPFTEDRPLAATTRKGRTRAAMTGDLLGAHRRGMVQVAIGRASDFFGPGVRDSAMGERAFAAVLAGKRVQVAGDPDLPHTYTYVEDIGRALATLGEHEEALGQVWHIPSPETVSTRQFIERIASAAGTRARVLRVPSLALRGVGLFNPAVRELIEMLYEFDEPFVVDHRKYAQTFGDQATPLDEAIGRTLTWHQRHAATQAAA
jgi:nucleoside-diphosphate-sugar epimerase